MKPGDHVAGYRIESVLGRGGMGTVYEATQLSLNRTVALKILAPQLGGDVLFRERFRREGHIQAAIDHPHIVTVYEAGEVDDGLFLAMRLVRGSTLKDMIVGRDLEGARTLRLLKPIADALDTAHEAGLTHRDIKPQNILVGVRDHAFLADFGLTKSATETGLTRTGQFVGTIDYVAPEQIRGEQAGPASDIYALTAVLYECLCGVVPYPKPSDAAVLYAHISERPPRVSDQRPELPPALDEVIARGMAKDASERPPTASQMIDEAERAFGKRVRAVITPPGPVEGPEEIGLREEESRISTRERRTREASSGSHRSARETAAASGDEAGRAAPPPKDEAGGPEAARATAPATEPAEPTVVAVPELPVSTPSERSAAAAPVGAPPADERAPPRAPGPARAAGRFHEMTASRRRLAGAALVGLIVLMGAVVLVGRDDSGETGQAPLVGSASNADVALDLPSRWRRAGGPPAFTAVGLTATMTLAAGPRLDSGLVVGRVEDPGTGLLPASLARRVNPAPGRGKLIRTTRLQGYRHEDLRVRGYAGRLDVLASPTSFGTLAFVCFFPAPGSSARGECERVVASARLVSGKPARIGTGADYASRVNDALKTLSREVRTRRVVLADARTQQDLSRAAAGLADVYEVAAGSVRRADPDPRAREANLAIARSLARASAAYTRLSSAADSGSNERFSEARLAVMRAERETRIAENGLRRLGYAVPDGR